MCAFGKRRKDNKFWSTPCNWCARGNGRMRRAYCFHLHLLSTRCHFVLMFLLFRNTQRRGEHEATLYIFVWKDGRDHHYFTRCSLSRSWKEYDFKKIALIFKVAIYPPTAVSMNTLPPLHHAGYHNDAGEVKRLLTGGVVKDINYVCKYEPFWNGIDCNNVYAVFWTRNAAIRWNSILGKMKRTTRHVSRSPQQSNLFFRPTRLPPRNLTMTSNLIFFKMFIPCVHYSKTICEGLTTLFIASASSHVEVVKTLLEYGRDTIDVRFDLQTRFDCPVHILPRWLSPFHSLHPLSRAHALNATFYIKLRCWLVSLCHFLRSIVWALCIAGE